MGRLCLAGMKGFLEENHTSKYFLALRGGGCPGSFRFTSLPLIKKSQSEMGSERETSRGDTIFLTWLKYSQLQQTTLQTYSGAEELRLGVEKIVKRMKESSQREKPIEGSSMQSAALILCHC